METFYRVIDFSGCKYHNDVYAMIKQNLELPNFFGHNLDALWDSLTRIMAVPANITIRGVTKLPKDLHDVAEEIVAVFLEAEATYGEIVVSVES